MNLQQKWRDFVCDPSRPGRYLSNIGRAVAEDRAEEINLDVLKDFLGRLAGGGADVELLATAVDLAYPGYIHFFCTILPTLLDSLANERIGSDAVVGPGLRGNPLWSRTSVARQSGKMLKTHYMTRLPTRSFLLLENLLVRWLVSSVGKAVDGMEARIGSAALPPQLKLIVAASRDAFAHHWFGQVSTPLVPTHEMISAAKRQRNPAYRSAAHLAERRAARTVGNATSRWLRTLDLLRANWIAPESSDDLFELYTLTLILDILEKDLGLGTPIESGLAIPGRSHVAYFESSTAGKVRVFFDQSPSTVLGARSRYREIVDAHSGLVGAPRRPDVIVAKYPSDEDPPIVMFFEVKESRDTSYTSDSIYKAMGYAFDYLSLWEIGPACPKVALLFPEEIALRPQIGASSLDIVLVSSMDREALVKAMSVRLMLPIVGDATSA